ncbi:hypothetical protein HDU97_008184 [Phlyctochytrium planicorne]|nr:hypothetical protein HDU97_008184 [Phlyctochytrium planicorne]
MASQLLVRNVAVFLLYAFGVAQAAVNQGINTATTNLDQASYSFEPAKSTTTSVPTNTGGPCSHDPLQIGPPLDPACDICVYYVVQLYAACGNLQWDFDCIDLYLIYCPSTTSKPTSTSQLPGATTTKTTTKEAEKTTTATVKVSATSSALPLPTTEPFSLSSTAHLTSTTTAVTTSAAVVVTSSAAVSTQTSARTTSKASSSASTAAQGSTSNVSTSAKAGSTTSAKAGSTTSSSPSPGSSSSPSPSPSTSSQGSPSPSPSSTSPDTSPSPSPSPDTISPSPTGTKFAPTTGTGSVPTQTASPCLGKADGTFICAGSQTLALCKNEVFSKSITCEYGTVCCPSKKSCTSRAQCPDIIDGTETVTADVATSTTFSPRPRPTVDPTICNGQPDFTSVCASGKTTVQCVNNEIVKGSSQTCDGAATCCLASGKCDLPDYCGVESIAASIDDIKITYTVNLSEECKKAVSGEKFCTSKNTFSVCQYGTIASTGTCSTGMLCCPDTNQCDYPSACPSVPPIRPKAEVLQKKNECDGLPGGFRTCSVDGFASLSCDGASGIRADFTCRYGKCCASTGVCPKKDGQCPNPCTDMPDGDFVCGSSREGYACFGDKPNTDYAIFCQVPLQICCAKTRACSSLDDC